ncbi:MAG: hypothetical protein ACL7BU_10835 [Candidatus Phlomobacter fragariae]
MNLDEETTDLESGKTLKRYYPIEIKSSDGIRVDLPANILWGKEKKSRYFPRPLSCCIHYK